MSYKWLLWFKSAVPDRFYDVKLFLDVVSVVITAVDGADGLPQATTPRAPPDVDGLVLELDAAYSASSIDSSDQVDRSQELTYVDIDTFLATF